MNIKTKRLGTALLAAALVTGGVTAPISELHAAGSASQAAQQTQVTLKWNGKALQTKGLMIKGQTLIPVAALRDDLKLPVSYNASDKSYTIGANYNKLKIAMGYDEPYVNVNGVHTVDMQARMVNNRLFVPIGHLKAYLGIDAAWNAAAKTVSMTKSQLNSVSIKTVNLSQEKSDTVNFDLKYPQLTGNQAGVDKINAVLKQHEEKVLAEIKKQIKEIGEATPDRPYQFESNYAVIYNRGGFISLIVDDYSYYGGAHGSTARTAFTFSLEDGKQLGLGDVLKANPDYKKTLNNKLLKQVPVSNGYLDGFKGLSDKPDFYVTGTGIVIFFQQYEYTAYAAGIPEFYYAFADLLPAGAKPFGK
ncbi:PdaC/SigV domain-containing protein [Paenibacillus jiagnxiensis]|uniref:PdaC/SigV domain-containing protein n=1 Tax=Paenibacillus jiagnxiensis TaxID=3228926 RepID=UPI0033A6F939